jgi:hypothetical protein
LLYKVFIVKRDSGVEETRGYIAVLMPSFINSGHLPGREQPEIMQTNGDIVAAGNAGFAPSNQSQFTSSFALARYLSGGQLDTAFGNEGRVSTSFGSTNVAFIAAMVIQNHGKIVVAGETGDAGGSIAVARYLAQ